MKRALLAIAFVVLGCGQPAAYPDPFGAKTTVSTAATAIGAQSPEQAKRAVAALKRPLRVYVAGESIEARNRWVHPPLTASFGLNELGGGDARNDPDEFGWMVPFADKLKGRDPSLDVQFVGASDWVGVDDEAYSGSYPKATPGRTSAISGTTVPRWLEERATELRERHFCYELAFVCRGGNDFENANDPAYVADLVRLLRLVAHGSRCKDRPVLYVASRTPDDRRDETMSEEALVTLQAQRYSQRTKTAVEALRRSDPKIAVHFVDVFASMLANKPTKALPNERWTTSRGLPDFEKIHRDGVHLRRLASIYVGELIADAIDLDELKSL